MLECVKSSHSFIILKDQKIVENKRKRLEQKQKEKKEKEIRLNKLRSQVRIAFSYFRSLNCHRSFHQSFHQSFNQSFHYS